MKTYIRKWDKEMKSYVHLEPRRIDAYEGLHFLATSLTSNATDELVGMRVRSIFLHASEPNALVVYVEEVKA